MANVQLITRGQTIKQALDLIADANLLTDEELAKLQAIPDADQIAVLSDIPDAAEIKTLYESNADTNVFTDDEKESLAALIDQNAVAGGLGVFSPRLGTSLGAWWDFGDAGSLTLATGDLVTSAADKSGNSNAAAQSNGSFKPKWADKIFNGLAPGIACGVTANLVAASASTIDNIFQNGGTVVVAFMIETIGQNQVILAKSADNYTTSGFFMQFYGSSSPVKLRFRHWYSTGNATWDIDGFEPGVPYVMEFYYNSSDKNTAPIVRRNGLPVTPANISTSAGNYVSDATGPLIVGNFTDGTTFPFLGTLTQMAIFKASQSATFLTQLRSYFGALSAMEQAPIYVLAGQSNMVGYADCSSSFYDNVPAVDGDTRPKIWDGKRFASLVASSNNQALNFTSFGPEISFSNSISDIIKHSAHIVKYAVSNTSLAVDWAPNPDLAGQFGLMQYRVQLATEYLASVGKIPFVAGFIWAQGEKDGENQTNANNYETNLRAFAAALKSIAFAKLGIAPDYRFVISGLPDQNMGTIPYQATVRTAQQTVGGEAGNIYVNTQDLGLEDGIHFNTQSALILGNRLALNAGVGFAQAVSGYYSNEWAPVTPVTRFKINTPSSLTGARVINALSGSVWFASAATSLVVTNKYVKADSIITGVIATNDSTMAGLKIVPADGSFTIYAATAPTSASKVTFSITP